MAFLAAAVSGFGPIYVLKEPLAEYYLLAHVVTSTIFGFCFAAYVVMAAHDSCLIGSTSTTAEQEQPENREFLTSFGFLQALFFWSMTVAGLGTLLSMLVCMFPLAGPTEQETLITIHLIAAYVLSAAVVLHAVVSIFPARKPIS